MKKPTLILNGNTVEFDEGQTILDVARKHGVDIPTLCYLKDTTPTGACRICLVEVEGARNLVASCATSAAPNMVIKTETDRVNKARRFNIELLLASGQHNCLVQDMDEGSWTDFQLNAMKAKEHQELCPAFGDCRLQELAIRYQVKTGRFTPAETPYPIENVNPFIIRDFSRCILCGRCVQACNEVMVNQAISFGYRGTSSKIVATGDRPYHESECVFCGQCIEVCPVGALTEKKALSLSRPLELEKVRTTCPYCGVGCQMWLNVKDEKIIKVTGVENAAPNQGRLCVKGRFGYDFIYSDERLKAPLIRENDQFREASWDEALDLVADKFKDIIDKYGPDAIAGVSCARSINEDSYQMQKLFRAVIGTNNIDHCART